MTQNHSKAQNMEEKGPYNHSEEKTLLMPFAILSPALDSLSLFANLSVPWSSGGNILDMIPLWSSPKSTIFHKLLESIKSIKSIVRAAERISLQRRAIFIEPLRWRFKSCPRTVRLRPKVSECHLIDFAQRMLQVWALRYVRAQPLDPLTVTECRVYPLMLPPPAIESVIKAIAQIIIEAMRGLQCSSAKLPKGTMTDGVSSSETKCACLEYSTAICAAVECSSGDISSKSFRSTPVFSISFSVATAFANSKSDVPKGWPTDGVVGSSTIAACAPTPAAAAAKPTASKELPPLATVPAAPIASPSRWHVKRMETLLSWNQRIVTRWNQSKETFVKPRLHSLILSAEQLPLMLVLWQPHQESAKRTLSSTSAFSK